MEPTPAPAGGRTTWDGMPVSREVPHGASIVEFRRRPTGPGLLMLHRSRHGPDYAGDWAWTPPAGARQPGESIDECARRELLEETGLELDLELTDCGNDEWWVYVTEAPGDAVVALDHEHDRYAWLSCSTAIARCRPDRACDPLRAAVLLVERACGKTTSP